MLLLLAACGSGGSDTVSTPTPTPTTPALPAIVGPAWSSFGRDAQHAALSEVATQAFTRILWQTPIDLAPQYSGSALLIHYGSPVISARNTVLLPVKTQAGGGFRIDARSATNGQLLWSANSDYQVPVHNWVPSYNLTLTAGSRVYAAGAGGKLLFRDDVDLATGALQTAVFYDAAAYNAAPATFDARVFINTPLTVDASGNVFFGFDVTSVNPAGLSSGIARVTAAGVGSWVATTVAASDATMIKVPTNSAPALSPDGRTLYVAVSNGVGRPAGFLLALDSTTLAAKGKVALLDPATGTPAWVSDDSTASPTIGPDGDVFYGVLEANAPSHNFRGWMLHFNAALTETKAPGSFGWDNAASIVPASMVPSYTGTSTYLLLTKYNNYGGAGTGDGKNRVAILDPNQAQKDSFSNAQVMREVFTILGVTPDPGYPTGVKEWCVNTVAVDPLTRSVVLNNEDGYLYRWSLVSNSFTERIQLNNGQAEAYTPTAVGPDGVVYAMNNAAVFAVGR